jgi:hypothetical protein
MRHEDLARGLASRVRYLQFLANNPAIHVWLNNNNKNNNNNSGDDDNVVSLLLLRRGFPL